MSGDIVSDSTTSGLQRLRPLRFAWPFLRPYMSRMLQAFACLSIAAVSALGMPLAIRLVIDHGFSRTDSGAVDKYFILLLALALVYGVFAAFRYYLVMWIGERVVADIRTAVYRHIITLSPAFFEVTRTGEVLSRLTTDTTLVQSVVGAGLSIALRSMFMLVGGLVMLFVTSAHLTGMMIVLLPVVVFPVLLYGRKVRRLSRTTQDRVADSSGIAGEVLNAINLVQAFTMERVAARRFAEAVERSFLAARRRLQASALLSGLIVLTAFAAIVVVLWIGAYSVLSGALSVGTLSQFLLYATIVAGSTTAIGEVWGDVQRAAGAMERLMELLSAQPDIVAPVQPLSLPERRLGHVRIEHITFSYPSRPQPPALRSFSLEIRPGEMVALVGPSGAGKSTVFQLLLRFYTAQSGSIKIDGVDIVQADPHEVRRRIGVVPQNTVLFADSIRENIRFGNVDADDVAVEQAARAAIAHDFIVQLPDGYDTFCGEKGVRLSGGQQQRIAIARAILKDPEILLLDEATSSLDSENERLVQVALGHLMRERSTLVVAHRLATVLKADRIVVLQEGQVIDSGRHEELLARGGAYARIAQLQLNGFDAGGGELASIV